MILSLLLTLALFVEPIPAPERLSHDRTVFEVVCDTIWNLDIEYITRNPEGYEEHCPDLIQPFWLRAPYEDQVRDSVHILFVAACESNFDVDANTRRWGTGTQGLLSFMRHLDWANRIYGYGSAKAEAWSAYVTIDASELAAVMVYDRVNPKVSPPNFWWWWSCARSYGHRFEAIFGPGTAPEKHYCPPPEYWKNVPAGSNFICGGRNYGG